ncbi:MAG: ASCH domain-containing protein [archaeon]
MKVDFEMRLNENPFFKIRNGEQIFEGRLNDSKRRRLEVGKFIRFYLRPKEKEFFDVRVVELRKYNSFKEMFEDLGAGVFGCDEDYLVEDFVLAYRKYYSEEMEKKFGVLGIRVEVVS